MQLLAPAAAVALLGIPAILALYVLKVRRPRSEAANLMLWSDHVVDRQADAPWQRLRPSLLLFVQLAVAAALALALMRPGLAGHAGVAKTTVVLIDGSPSMLATDVAPSRFAAAVTRAGRLARQLGRGRQMAVIVVGDHARLLTPPTSDPAVIASALDRARPSGQPARLDEAISLANAVLAGRPGGSVLLLGDGHARPSPAGPTPRLGAPLVFERIGRSGDNAGWRRSLARPAGRCSSRWPTAAAGRGT